MDRATDALAEKYRHLGCEVEHLAYRMGRAEDRLGAALAELQDLALEVRRAWSILRLSSAEPVGAAASSRPARRAARHA